MNLVLVTPPVNEPVSRSVALAHVKETLTGADINTKIDMCIAAARQMAENDLRRALITQTWKLVLDRFPRPGNEQIASANWYGQWGNTPGPLQGLLPDGTTGFEIYLPLPPLQTINSVNYVDTDGVAQTLNVTTDIYTYRDTEPSLITPAYNTSWPGLLSRSGAASITYTCGYGDTDVAVPAAIKMWMLTQIGAMYDLPQAEIAAYRETLLEPNFVDRLLDPYRVRRY